MNTNFARVMVPHSTALSLGRFRVSDLGNLNSPNLILGEVS